MLPKNVAELDREYPLRLEKRRREGKRLTDATLFSSFPKSTELTLSLVTPCFLGVRGVSLDLKKDGETDTVSVPFTAEYGADEDRFSAALSFSELLAGEESGLFYAHLVFDRGEKSYSDTENQLDFVLKPTRCRPFRFLIYEDGFRTPEWFPGGVMYHIFVDRFARGSRPVPKREDAVYHDDWDRDLPEYAEVRGGEIRNNDFFGGTLWGAAEKLDYLASVGVTVLYLSPIFTAYSNHKYDTGDYETVDPGFGGEEALSFLLSEAKKRGMRVILDGVFNHTGDDSKYFNKYGKYPTVGAYQSKASPYADWFTFRSFPDDYECWWGIPILPRLRSDLPSLTGYLAGENGIVEKYCNMGVSGFRLDVADELDDGMIEAIRAAVARGSGNDGLVIGEVWENAADKIAYGKRRRYFRGRQLDSVMNYPGKDAIISYLLTGNAEAFASVVTGLYASYPKQVSDCLMNLLGSHDTERILTVLGGDGSRERMTQEELSRYRLSPERRALAVKRLKIASLLQFTLYGVPSVYYGDEAGLEGCSDPFCRLPFPWGRENEELLSHYRFLGTLRKEHPALRDGIFRVITARNGALLFERKGGTETLFVAVNLGKEPFPVPLPDGCRVLTGPEGTAPVLAGGEYAVFRKKNK
ncbi:MAG: glycoside hydrolase family 13 protein [Lachnospiraceae bacterium]|nr:glycoside hydrolase family 13 protein [Lachnospiraceae bacterium]